MRQTSGLQHSSGKSALAGQSRSIRRSRKDSASYSGGKQTKLRSRRLSTSEGRTREGESNNPLGLISIDVLCLECAEWSPSGRSHVVIPNENHALYQHQSVLSVVLRRDWPVIEVPVSPSVFRLVQNLVFYGVSQNTGAWPLDPYLSFGISAVVELLAYILVHLILDRVGRKGPYCGFAVLFGLVAFSVLPVQQFMEKDSAGK